MCSVQAAATSFGHKPQRTQRTSGSSAVYVILMTWLQQVHGTWWASSSWPGGPRHLGRGGDDRKLSICDMSTGVVPLVECMVVGRTPLYRGGGPWPQTHPHEHNLGRWQDSSNRTAMGLKPSERQIHAYFNVSVHRRQLIRYSCNVRAMPHATPLNLPNLRRIFEHTHCLHGRVG